MTPHTNQRIHLAQLCYDWSHDAALNGERTGGCAFLDAKITGWNLRDKKVFCIYVYMFKSLFIYLFLSFFLTTR